jgi:hypothetical protein
VLEGGTEPTTHTLQLELHATEVRQLARVGIEFEVLSGTLGGVIVNYSTDGEAFHDWPGPAPEGPLTSPLWAPAAAPVSARAVRLTVVLNSGSLALTRIFACESLEGTASKPEPIIPALTSDGRTLFALNVAPRRRRAEEQGQEGQSQPQEEDEEEGEGQRALEVHAIDLSSGEAAASARVALDVDQAGLHKHALATNGHQLLLLSTSTNDLKRPVYSATVVSVEQGEVLESRGMSWEETGAGGAGPSLAPQCMCYDLWNNYVWGLDPTCSKVAHWQNAGLPPRPRPPRPPASDLLFSPVPAFRLEGLASLEAQHPSTSASAGDTSTSLQAARILACLDLCSEIYSPPDRPAGGSARHAANNEVVVASAGRDEGFANRFSVRGMNVGPLAAGKGFNLVRLDARYNPVDFRTFDTTPEGAPSIYNELMLEYISRLPDGTVVLVASKEEAARGLSALGKRALRMLGADASVENLEKSDCFALIGRKGAPPARVVQKIVKRGTAVAVAKQHVPITHEPLSLEPTPQVGGHERG